MVHRKKKPAWRTESDPIRALSTKYVALEVNSVHSVASHRRRPRGGYGMGRGGSQVVHLAHDDGGLALHLEEDDELEEDVDADGDDPLHDVDPVAGGAPRPPNRSVWGGGAHRMPSMVEGGGKVGLWWEDVACAHSPPPGTGTALNPFSVGKNIRGLIYP